MATITVSGYANVVTDRGDITVWVGEADGVLSHFSRVSVDIPETLPYTITSAVNNNLVPMNVDSYGKKYISTTPPIPITGTSFVIDSGSEGVIRLKGSGDTTNEFSYISGTRPQITIPIVTKLFDGTYSLLCVNYNIINAYYVGVVTAYTTLYAPSTTGSLDLPQLSYIQPEFFAEWEQEQLGVLYTVYAVDEFQEYLSTLTPGPTPREDPYEQGGESEEGGGEGDFDTFSDEIPIPELPNLTVDNTGFISLYSPSIAQLKSLASYLWASTGLDLETFKRIFTDPISTILGLTIVPVVPPTGASNNVVLGNVDTGVSMPRVSNQYVQFDCGTLNVNEFWGGYLDYSPYTSLEIYLPFIGTKPLNIDDVMGHTIHVVYNIDLLSGACCAIIESARRVLYQFIGQCSCSVPVTGRDMTNLINGILSVVGAGAGTFVATGGNPGLSGASAIGALASNVTKSKPKVEKSGSMGSMGGMLGVRRPYLIITRPRQALPSAQNRYTGYPSFITCVLSELVGYTEVYKVHLGDIPATDAEKAEIETLLMNGVIL